MLGFIIDNVVVIGVGVAAFIAGGLFMPQSLKDKLSGVSPDLRAAINARLAQAQKVVADAQAKALADVAKAIAPPMPVPPANPLPASAVTGVTGPA